MYVKCCFWHVYLKTDFEIWLCERRQIESNFENRSVWSIWLAHYNKPNRIFILLLSISVTNQLYPGSEG